MLAWPIDHVDVADLEALAAHQRRKEAMQTVEIWQRQEQVAAKRLEPTSGIARAILQHGRAHPVGNTRLHALEPARLAADALPGDQPEPGAAAFERIDEYREKGRVVLAIAIERRDNRPARVLYAGANGGGLSARRDMADLPQIRPFGRQRQQVRRRCIGGTVIDVDDLEAAARQGRFNFRDKRPDIAGLVA